MSGFSGAFKCFRSCLECHKRLLETEEETGFLIGPRRNPPIAALPSSRRQEAVYGPFFFRSCLAICPTRVSLDSRSIMTSLKINPLSKAICFLQVDLDNLEFSRESSRAAFPRNKTIQRFRTVLDFHFNRNGMHDAREGEENRWRNRGVP